MDVRQRLEELNINEQLPPGDFKQLPAFSELESAPDIIVKVESLHLPEITKLICCSESLSKYPWAQKYAKVRPLYLSQPAPDIEQAVFSSKSKDDFCREILQFADRQILEQLLNYFTALSSDKEQLRKSRDNLTNRISRRKKAGADMSEAEAQRDKMTKQLEELRQLIKELLPFEKAVRLYLDKIEKINRSQVLKIIESIIPPERPQENTLATRLRSFVPFDDDRAITAELESSVKQALEEELLGRHGEKDLAYADFWNGIVSQEAWVWIINKVHFLAGEESTNAAIAKIASCVCGEAAEFLAEAISDESMLEVCGVTIGEVILASIDTGCALNDDIMSELIKRQEQQLAKTKRRLRAAERKARSLSQDLFSSIYQPTERLERLAINLITHKEVNAALISANLMRVIRALRGGYEELGLHPSADIDEWEKQKEVRFDPELHQLIMPGEHIPERVKLETLGFRYKDEDGEWKQHRAQVYSDDEVKSVPTINNDKPKHSNNLSKSANSTKVPRRMKRRTNHNGKGTGK